METLKLGKSDLISSRLVYDCRRIAGDNARIQGEFALQAQKYDTDHATIMLAWLLKHPTKMTPIIGSTTPTRIQTAKQALDLDYTREDWYRLREARNGHPVP